MLVRLLGATSVRRGDGEWSPIGSRAVRSLLAGLATHPNTTVSIDTLTGWVWGEDLPARPQAALQTVASRLRTILREALPDTSTSTSTSTSSVAVEAVPGGYLLRIDPDLIDATRFETLLRHARTTTRTEHPPAAIARYDEALALWDGDHALIDSTPTTYAHTEAARLNELRLTAVQERLDLLLHTHPAETLDELARLTARHPLREAFTRQYMTALAATGRRADALTAYRRLDRALRDELGIDPDPHTQALHTHLLDQRPLPTHTAPAPAPTPAEPEPTEAAERPIRVGSPPALAAAFQVRTELRSRVCDAWGTQTAVVITQVLAGDGGVGKTQLAAALFHDALETGQVELGVWVTATSREAVIAAYAAALELIHPEPAAATGTPETVATTFVNWLSDTDRRWLVVLDDVADPAHLNALRPRGRHGRVLVTTRRRDAATTALGTIVDVGLFSPRESLAYLRERLTQPHIPPAALHGAEQLAADLGHLPLALAQAAAVIIDDAISCADYRTLLTDRTRRLSEIFPADPRASGDDYTHALPAAWSLATERATATDPLVPAMLRLVAVLDPNGIPEKVLLAPPVSDYLDTDYSTGPRQARAALRTAHHFSLLTHTPDDPTRSVRMHALAQRATLDHLTDTELDHVVRAAADAVLAVWPANNASADRIQVVKTQVKALSERHPEALRSPHLHPVLLRAGHDLGRTAQVRKAVEYYTDLVARTTASLGPDHPSTLDARFQLADAMGQAGDLAGALREFQATLADRTRVLGPLHRDTLVTRYETATWRGELGDAQTAVRELEQLSAEVTRVLGPEDPLTLSVRHDWAFWRCETGDPAGAVAAFAELLPVETRVSGADSPGALSLRHYLARARGVAGDPRAAVEDLRVLVDDATRIFGQASPYTLMSRKTLAHWRGHAGDPQGALRACQELVADDLRLLGHDHPLTFEAREELTYWRGATGDVEGARASCRELLTDLLELFGQDHPQTRRIRAAMAEWEQDPRGGGDLAVTAPV